MMKKIINYGKHHIDNQDIKIVIDTLKNNKLTQGSKVEEFEKKLSKYFGSKYSCAVNSGTSALHLALKCIDLKKNDIVITTPNTFLATANSILYNNGIPHFVDINKYDYNLDLNYLEDKIKFLKRRKHKLKAVIGVDFAGQPCDWKGLRFLANKYNFLLINDNCHAMGAEISKNKKYAIKYADLVTHSYHPVKHITTGEGGSILTNSKKFIDICMSMRSHGVVKNKNMDEKNGLWYYEMRSLGYNFRLSDIQCSLGISQLYKLNKFIGLRKKIAKIYDNKLKNWENVKIPFVKKEISHAYHLYVPLFDFNNVKITKKEFFKKMKKSGINLQVHYIPIYRQPYYKKNFKFNEKDYPNTNDYNKKCISLPIYPGLKNNDINYVCENIKRYFK